MANPKNFRSILLIVVGLLLAILSATQSPRGLVPVTAAQVLTPTAVPNLSTEKPITPLEIGTTDGIMVWGTLLVIIVLVAVAWHHADWAKPKTP